MSADDRDIQPLLPGLPVRWIYRPWRRLPNGRVIWARHYGLRAWRIPVAEDDNRKL